MAQRDGYRFTVEPWRSEGVAITWRCPHLPCYTLRHVIPMNEWERWQREIIAALWRRMQEVCYHCAALPMPSIGDMRPVEAF